MQDFQFYFNLGWHHILDLRSYSHALFILALYSAYNISDLKKLLILFMSFTVGYSTIMVLGLWYSIPVSAGFADFIIPGTVLVMALYNIVNRRKRSKKMLIRYLMSACFGLIHGLAFSGYFKGLISKDSNLVTMLSGFNLGLEFGQLIIMAGSLLLSFILLWIIKIRQTEWNFFISSAIFGIAFILSAEKLQMLL